MNEKKKKNRYIKIQMDENRKAKEEMFKHRERRGRESRIVKDEEETKKEAQVKGRQGRQRREGRARR